LDWEFSTYRRDGKCIKIILGKSLGKISLIVERSEFNDYDNNCQSWIIDAEGGEA
jgi:hypothetical protein